MELSEMIKVMQHYGDGGEIEVYKNDRWTIGVNPIWDWDTFDYRIKEPKRKVTIEKWLCEYVGCEELKGSKRFFIIEKVVPFEMTGKKLKLIETYEVEL